MRIAQTLQRLRDTIKDDDEFWVTLGVEARKDYWLYLRTVLQYNFLDPWDHGEELIHFLQANLGKPMMIMVPRGGIKTGAVTIPFVPWKLAEDPLLRAIITNARENRAQHFGREAANILNSAIYRACYPYIESSDKWGDKGYFLRSVSIEGEQTLGRVDPSLAMYGMGGNMTGSHVRVILHDDLINEDIARSAIELERAEAFFKESLNCIDPGGQMMVICTRWRYNDFYGKVESGELECNGEPFRIFKRGAERVVLDDTGQPVVEIFNRHRVYFDINGKRQEIGYTPEGLESQKKAHGAMYYALYMNDPVGDADRQLNHELVREFVRFPIELSSAVRLGIEIEAGAAAFYSTFTQTMRDESRRTPVEKLSAPKDKDKHTKIRAVAGQIIEDSRLYIREDLWHRPGGLGQEIREFDRGEDDALDALCMAIDRAPKYRAGKLPIPYVAVDPAFTANKQSNHTAILVGCWYGNDFYVLECDKFKSSKVDFITRRILKWVDKYSFSGASDTATKKINTYSPYVSKGNEPRFRIRNSPFTRVWGNGIYKDEIDD